MWIQVKDDCFVNLDKIELIYPEYDKIEDVFYVCLKSSWEDEPYFMETRYECEYLAIDFIKKILEKKLV